MADYVFTAMQKIVLIGAGNVACTLGPELQAIESYEVVQVWSRTEDSAHHLASVLNCDHTTDLNQVRRNADIYIYSVKDSVLTDVLSTLTFHTSPLTSHHILHLHTAGSAGLDVFGDDKPHCGVIYPFQTFSRSRRISMAGIPIFIESKLTEDLEQIRNFARQISGSVYDFASDNRQWLHLAGVFANNFTNVMYGIAAEKVKQAGLLPDVLQPLMQETINKLLCMSAREAQTGPAVRGDKAVMQHQLELLTDPKQKDIYRLMSDYIVSSCRNSK